MDALLTPPLAFLIYGLVGLLLAGLGRLLAGPSQPNALKNSPYAGGEAAPPGTAAQGYGPYFVNALFFGLLHLGVLVLATSRLSGGALLFGLGLAAALLVLLWG